ncbi:hypothetical protein ACFQH6_19790 [Halobacteriaceae archaeon GCM10025711]
MSTTSEFGNEGSYSARIDQYRVEECPECAGRLVADGTETYCESCGLVVVVEDVTLGVSSSAHGPSRRGGPEEWAVEPTTVFRVNHGLGSTFNLGRDGRGNGLSVERKRRFGRLRRLDKRMDGRDIRLNEGLRDVQSIAGNLGLPRFVGEDACRLLRLAAERRLPGGRMAWESLAAGAVMLAAKRAGVPRETEGLHCMRSRRTNGRVRQPGRFGSSAGSPRSIHPSGRTWSMRCLLSWTTCWMCGRFSSSRGWVKDSWRLRTRSRLGWGRPGRRLRRRPCTRRTG